MKAVTFSYIFLCFLLWPVLFISKCHDIVLWQKISVPLFVTLVFFYNYYLNPLKSKNDIFLFFAFLFVCAGDFIVNLTELGAWFIVPFVLVHINLIIYFSRERPWEKKDILYSLPILIMSVTIYTLMWNSIGSTLLRVVFAAYLLLLSTMLWRAAMMFTTGRDLANRIMITAGAMLFYITDVSVASNEVLKTGFLVALTWICYPPALVMLSLMNFPFVEEEFARDEAAAEEEAVS